MPRVVYLLGAGFSAPLGLPVTANFLAKAKDLYTADPRGFEHFGEVFAKLRELAFAKNYFSSDQQNIEEVLSILEMAGHVGPSSPAERFGRFIDDVITAHTPKIEPVKEWPPRQNQMHDALFGRDDRLWPYGVFAIGLFEANAKQVPQTSMFHCVSQSSNRNRYDVITLNYDRVLEVLADATLKHPFQEPGITFATPLDWTPDSHTPLLAKLHGSAGGGPIVPPTWQKGRHDAVLPAWRAAHTALRGATVIRVIGYSIPEADAYIRYLLKSAVTESPNLQSIEVICLDPTGDVERRYRSFIDFSGFRFANAKTEVYLNEVRARLDGPNTLEGANESFWQHYLPR